MGYIRKNKQSIASTFELIGVLTVTVGLAPFLMWLSTGF
jgi:hypothetical protein